MWDSRLNVEKVDDWVGGGVGVKGGQGGGSCGKWELGGTQVRGSGRWKGRGLGGGWQWGGRGGDLWEVGAGGGYVSEGK